MHSSQSITTQAFRPQTSKHRNPLRVDRVIVRSTPADRFRRDELPPPTLFYPAELGKFSRPNRKGWCLANCPFHNSKSGKSFAINIETGGFRCWGCDARGGDIVDFLRRRYGLSFKEACQQLGCWDEDGQPVVVRPGPLVRYLVLHFSNDGNQFREQVRDEPTTELQLDRRLHAAAADRLAEIRKGDAEVFDGEEETQWGILATSWEVIRMEVDDGK